MALLTHTGRVIQLCLEPADRETLLVVSAEGREKISTPYRYDLELVSKEKDLDLAAHFAKRVWLELKGLFAQGKGVLRHDIAGILWEIHQCDSRAGWVAYRAVLVPQILRLSLDVRTRIFLKKSVVQIAQEILLEHGFVDGTDFEFRLNERYPEREHVVQYQESDLDFLSRLLEHWGIFYFFEQAFQVEKKPEKIVFADAPEICAPIQPAESFPYRPKSPAPCDWYDEETVREFTYRHTRVPAAVLLQDYADATPSVDLKTQEEVAKHGEGTVYLYGEHYGTQEEGKFLARIRAEEIRGREKLFSGTSNARGFHAGARCTLNDHYRTTLNAPYRIVEVRHRIEQTLPLGGIGDITGTYVNEFRCMPAEVPFRPERTTPRPKIGGAVHARIDAPGDGTYAELDERGRYKLKFSYDLSDRGNGTASPFVRMAQAYAGNDYGFHCPQHKGIEALVAYENGDPNRPLILATAPNPETSSPVQGANQTQCAWKSAGANAIVFEDLKDSERFLIRAAKNLEIRAKNDTFEMTEHDRHLKVLHDQIEFVDNDRHEKIGRDHVQEIGGRRHVSISSHDVLDVAGKSSLTVEGDVVRVFLANHSEETSGNHCLKASHVVLEADGGITLKCGGSSVVVDAAGVTLTGPMLALDGAAKINSGPGSPPASFAAGAGDSPSVPRAPGEPGDVSVGGTTAAGTPEEAGVAPSDGGSHWIGIELKDKEGKPVPRELYEIKAPDGRVIRGRLDKEGKAVVKGVTAGNHEVTFPRRDKDSWDPA